MREPGHQGYFFFISSFDMLSFDMPSFFIESFDILSLDIESLPIASLDMLSFFMSSAKAAGARGAQTSPAATNTVSSMLFFMRLSSVIECISAVSQRAHTSSSVSRCRKLAFSSRFCDNGRAGHIRMKERTCERVGRTQNQS